MFFYNEEWKIVANINLTKYRTELNNVQNIVSVIISNCEELKLIEMEKNASTKGNEGCGPILYRLNILMADIDENHSNWFGKDTRVKRNIVSELVLDDWPADHFSFVKEFKNMSARGRETSTVPDKETSYISSTFNSFGESTETNQVSINDYVANQLSFVHNTLVAARNGSVNVVRLFQLRTTIQDIISYQMLILTTFTSKQKQFLSIMPLVGEKNAQIPNVLPSDTVLSELLNIRNIVSEKGLDFPTKLTNANVHFLFQLSSPEISLFNDQIFVTFKVPLISKLSGNHFTLIKVTSSLHHLKDNLYSFVIPNHDFIAIDAHKEHYSTLTAEDLSNCHQISNGTSIICKQSTVMSTMTASECEISLLRKQVYPVEDAINCKVRYIRSNAEIFIKVLKPNSWLVTMPKSTKVRHMCDGKATEEFFDQINGLLTIGSNCKFATDNVVITGHNTLAKSSIYEHLTGISSEKLAHQMQMTNRILIDNNFASNNIPQVINFGEHEKLFRMSFGLIDVNMSFELTNLSERVTHVTEVFDFFIVYWMIVLSILFTSCLVLFVVRQIFVCVLSKRKAERKKLRIQSEKSIVQSKKLKSCKPSAPTTSDMN